MVKKPHKKAKKIVKPGKVIKQPKNVDRLSKEEYHKALKHPKWQKKRLKVFQRDNWRCTRCKDPETELHVHHLQYTKRYPWNEPMANLTTLCGNCHRKVHNR